MTEVIEFAHAGGYVMGICNGFQVCCEAGLLPGALLTNISRRFVCRQVELRLVGDPTAFTRALDPAETLSIPVKHTTGRYFAPPEMLERMNAAGQVVLRYAPGQNPNGSLEDIAGVVNEAGNVLRPDAPSRARRRSADRLHRRARPVRVVGGRGSGGRLSSAPAAPWNRACARARTHAVRVRADRDAPGARAQRGRAGDVLAVVVGALLLQALQAAACGRCRPRARDSCLGPGENAGAVDVGGGLAVAFKVESHNHPSAVEPFQGAATGVGGILRDIFAVGARPIAVLDSLRFGEPTSERSRYLLEHAVAGIGHYGNSIGVPTVGGEVYFERPYEQNCLINAMCVGLIETERLIRSAASGPGNMLVLFGASTGRDGIGGASVLASAELGEGDAGKAAERPDRRPLRREEADGVLARAARARPARRAPGPRRRRPDLRRCRDGEQGRRSGSTSTSRACRCARQAWSRSRSWSRSPRSGCSASSRPELLDAGPRGLRALGDRRRA